MTNSRNPLPRRSVAGALGLVVLLGACSSSATGGKQQSLSSDQTVVIAVQGGTTGGLGSEGKSTADEIASFEKAHPNVHVKVQALASTTDQAYQQVQRALVAGSATPDVIDADNTWVATFAKAGWVKQLDGLGPDTARFFPGQVAGASYQDKLYGLPWYINVEGLYYRTDLVPTPPKSPAEVVAAAKAALQADPKLKEGLAFEGSKYEGVVCAFIAFLGGFGGTLDLGHLDTPQVRQTLQYMHDLIYVDKVAPQAVTGWTEDNVGQAFTSGQAPFATNWPYVFQAAEAKDSSVAGKTGWIPFPSATGHPTAPLGGSVMLLNAKSSHQAAAWALMQWMTDPGRQTERALSAGDPPSVRAAYTAKLYAAAPYYKQEEAVFAVTTSRPITPRYPQVTAALQLMLSQVLSDQTSVESAVSTAASTVKGLGADS